MPASFDTREVAERTPATGRPCPLSIRIAGLAPNQPYQLEIVDARHGCALTEWQRLGSPVNLSKAQAQVLRICAARGMTTEHRASADGVLAIESILSPWAIGLLTPYH